MNFIIKLYQDAKGEWRWQMKARNGRIVSDGAESYVTRDGCIKAIKRMVGASITAVY